MDSVSEISGDSAAHLAVALVRAVTADGRVLPAGDSGTVVTVDQGKPPHFEVSFEKPFVATVTLSGVDLTV